MHGEYGMMGMPGVGFFGLLIIGGLAGWLAERAMNRNHGLLTNILVGIAGSFVGGTLAGILGIQFYGFVGNLVVATLGAVLILWFFGKKEPGNRVPPADGQYIGGVSPGEVFRTKDDQ
ncbi:MAG: GlsB/YeaQ/YmgE family stress response membrane protein [Nitratireductor sp.]|nr:GlsB/YeaQ/YmgE family stress response membrane protein [Nitratireductor sp.]